LSKIENFVENWKILSKIEKFCRKLKILSKIENFSKISTHNNYFPFSFNGDTSVDINKQNKVDKYIVTWRGLQELGVSEQEAFDCMAGAKPSNMFPGAHFNGGCDYTDCVGEKILIW